MLAGLGIDDVPWRAVQDLAVVPHRDVALGPAVADREFRPRGMGLQHRGDRRTFGRRQIGDALKEVRRDIQRPLARIRVNTDHRVLGH